MQDRKVEISLALVQGIMQYLQTRPYSEVAGAIKAIEEQVAPQIQAAPTAPTEPA